MPFKKCTVLIFSVWIVSLLERWIIFVSTTTCHNVTQCAGFSNITSRFTTVECFGDRSCEFATLIKSTENAKIKCDGSWSCFFVESIQHSNNISNATISCGGLFSCAEINHIENTYGSIECDGEQSCMHSNIFNYDPFTNREWFPLRCRGHSSCIHTSIITQTNVNFGGYLSGGYSIINQNYTQSNMNLTFRFRGAKSGYSSTIECLRDPNNRCDIYCYGDSCNGLTLSCLDPVTRESTSADNCTINVFCDSAEQSDVCPDGYDVESASNVLNTYVDFKHFPDDIKSTPNSTSDNSYNVCNWSSSSSSSNGSSINCGDYDDTSCTNGAELRTTMSNPGAICCTASHGCNGTSNITSVIDYSVSDYDFNISIRCDGDKSCIFGKNYILSRPIGAGDIFATGRNAIGFKQDERVTISTSGDYDIVCSGYESCTRQEISGANNLYCTGQESCLGMYSINNVNNIFAFGYIAAILSSINNVGDIYCSGLFSCYQTNIYDVSGDVFGKGESVLESSYISNVNGSVIGIGSYALSGATIIDAGNVVCYYKQACVYTTMIGIHDKIVMNYSYGLDGAVIISDQSLDTQDDNSTLYIYVGDETSSIGWDLYCNRTDTCYIDCQLSHSCYYVTVHCFGECFVACDNDTDWIICPENGNEPDTNPFKIWIKELDLITDIASTISLPYFSTDHDTTSMETQETQSSSTISTGSMFISTFAVSDSEFDQDQIVIMLTIIGGSLAVLCICVLLIYLYHEKRAKLTQSAMNQINEMKKNSVVDHMDPNFNANGNKRYKIDARALSRVRSVTRDGSRVQNQNVEDSYDEAIGKILRDLENKIGNYKDEFDNVNDNDNDEELYNYMNAEGNTKDKENEHDHNNDDDGLVVEGAPNNRVDENTHNAYINPDDFNDWKNWTHMQAFVWVKNVLIANKLDLQQVYQFLKELGKKSMNGKSLERFQNDPKLLDGFMMQFSVENQSLTIWMAIKASVDELPHNV